MMSTRGDSLGAAYAMRLRPIGQVRKVEACLLRRLLRLHSSQRLKCRRLLGIQGSCQGTCTFPKTFSAFCCVRLMASQILIPILQKSDRVSTRSSFKVDREVIVMIMSSAN